MEKSAGTGHRAVQCYVRETKGGNTVRISLTGILVITCIALLAVPGVAMASLDSFDASDEELAAEFCRLLKEKDVAGLEAFLSPHFLLQRSDGHFMTKEDYIKAPARIDDFVVTDVVGQRVDNVRVIRYMLSAMEAIDGVWLTKDPMPRISTFHWNGERWQLLSHANFTPIAAAN